MNARGRPAEEGDHEGQSVTSEDNVVMVPRSDATLRKGKRRGTESLSATNILGNDELTRQKKVILRDKKNIIIKRSLVNNEIMKITHKIEALDDIRTKLEKDLIKLQEDDLELDDECDYLSIVEARYRFMTLTVQGVKERLEFEQSGPARMSQSFQIKRPAACCLSRARRATSRHTVPISALDFSEQYGTLVSASIEDSQSTARNLLSGTEPGRLRGHVETVKCIQIEDTVCVTGSEDCSVRLWDLRLVDADGSDGWGDEARTGQAHRTLVGHSAPVTCLQFDEVHIASGSLDKTIQIWDVRTGGVFETLRQSPHCNSILVKS
ncbi:hypothetical protein HHX47_DHR1000996 [Lentinula edodes]|nr:hypothetical protein HHX47_DHR1000996 [Lentinula edodes]